MEAKCAGKKEIGHFGSRKCHSYHGGVFCSSKGIQHMFVRHNSLAKVMKPTLEVLFDAYWAICQQKTPPLGSLRKGWTQDVSMVGWNCSPSIFVSINFVTWCFWPTEVDSTPVKWFQKDPKCLHLGGIGQLQWIAHLRSWPSKRYFQWYLKYISPWRGLKEARSESRVQIFWCCQMPIPRCSTKVGMKLTPICYSFFLLFNLLTLLVGSC